MSPCPAVWAVCGPDGLSTWQYVEEEAIDLCCRPEFVEIAEGGVGDSGGGSGGGPTSALRIIVLVEQT